MILLRTQLTYKEKAAQNIFSILEILQYWIQKTTELKVKKDVITDSDKTTDSNNVKWNMNKEYEQYLLKSNYIFTDNSMRHFL